MSYENDIPLSLAQSAHSGTSMVPERRAVQEREGYASTLAKDYEHLKAQATAGGTLDLLDAEFDRYREGYGQRTRAYLSSRSRCLSPMITGPSNFPVARNEKRNNASDRRLEDLVEFRKRALAAIGRTLRPDLAPISSDRPTDALEVLREKLANLEKSQVIMVGLNKVVRAFWKAGVRNAESGPLWARYLEKCREVHPGMSDGHGVELLTADACGLIGFPDYATKNNNANIRRVREQVGVFEKKAAAMLAALEDEQDGQAPPETQCDGYRVVQNVLANRVQLMFPGKPSSAVRDYLKGHGFRWSPTQGAWQRHLNEYLVERVTAGDMRTQLEALIAPAKAAA